MKSELLDELTRVEHDGEAREKVPMKTRSDNVVQCHAIRWEQFCGYAVLDYSNKALWMKTTFQTKYVKAKMFFFYYEDLNSNIIQKMHTNTIVALKPNSMSSSLNC